MSHPPGGGYAAILPLRLELPGESLAEHCGAKAPTGGFAAQILPPSPTIPGQAKTICDAYSFTIKPRGGLHAILRNSTSNHFAC